ncbi:putative MFS family arabinose efflux permease [Sphingopyxis panaciterrae]|uniref:MFS transporter n=1 Tax=Sphingopyxis panaciterrae TaxID=363841 RepID=UPI00141F6BD6|nr:MFS transporter [Sphingopyxis panaciterrae]NIJ39707.1 putative MFS family arabinose efflux permease [Sphingopyxis panaciterrae]
MTAAPPPVTGRTLGVSLLIGSCALLVLGVQPVLLGAMVEEGRIIDAEVGNLVTVEMLAMVLGSLAGIALLRQLPARLVIGLAGLALAGLNLAMTGRSGLMILLLLRAAAGIGEGVLVASALVAISRVARVERASAIFLAAQTLLQAVVAALLPLVAVAGSRTDSALIALAAAGAVAAVAALSLPSRLRPTAPDAERGALTPASLTALAGAGLFLGAIVSVWSYFGLWLIHYGYPPAFEGIAVSLCLVAQVAGALTAARFGERLPNRRTIAACALAGALLVTAFFLGRGSAAAIIAVSIAFGFVWLFTLPFFAGWLIEIDPARRAILYLTAFQLGGAALLPSLAGVAVGRFSVDAMLVFSGAIFVTLAAVVRGAGKLVPQR